MANEFESTSELASLIGDLKKSIADQNEVVQKSCDENMNQFKEMLCHSVQEMNKDTAQQIAAATEPLKDIQARLEALEIQHTELGTRVAETSEALARQQADQAKVNTTTTTTNSNSNNNSSNNINNNYYSHYSYYSSCYWLLAADC